jgi:O-antigen/teichoic acid export membrane protein
MDPDERKLKKFREKRKLFFENINSENLLKNTLQIGSNALIIAFINLLFQLLMSRYLGPVAYGELQTLLIINTALLMTVSAVGFVVAKFVTYYKSRQQYDMMKFLAHWSFVSFFFIGIAGFILNLMMSRITAEFLHIDILLIQMFGMLIWISFMMPIIEGILRGLQEFKFVGRYRLLDAILNLILASIMIFLGFNIHGVIGGLVIASIITILFSGNILRKIYISKPYKIRLKEIYKFAFPVFIACLSFAIIANIDMILVKHFFSEESAGFYAAAGILAKMVLGLAFGSAGVMFPKVVEEYDDANPKEAVKILNNTLKINFLSGAILSIIIALFPKTISGLIFGTQYNIDYMLSIYVIAMLLLSFSVILMMYNLAVKKYSFINMFVLAAVVTTYQIFSFHSTVYVVVWALLSINLLLAVFMGWYNRKELFYR